MPLVISKEFHAVAQLDDKDPITVRIQHEGETRTLNFNASQDGATVQPAAFWPLIRYEGQSGVTSSIFNFTLLLIGRRNIEKSKLLVLSLNDLNKIMRSTD